MVGEMSIILVLLVALVGSRSATMCQNVGIDMFNIGVGAVIDVVVPTIDPGVLFTVRTRYVIPDSILHTS